MGNHGRRQLPNWPVPLDVLIDREVDALDKLAAACRLPIKNQLHLHDLEEQANGIAERLRTAFRGQRAQ